LLSIRNFVVVETLDLELDAGFTVLTGETGAGKSILLDALTCSSAIGSSCGNCGRAPSEPSSPPCSS
jgi:DNA repair ATPase RecN